MESRCPYDDCGAVLEVADELAMRAFSCYGCGRVVSLKPLAVLEDIERNWQRRKNAGQLQGGPAHGDELSGLVAVVEDVRSLFNVGSILRTADGAGFRKAYLCGITGAPPRKEVTKTSLGAEEFLSWEYCRDAMEPLRRLQQSGSTIICLEKNHQSRPLAAVLETIESASSGCWRERPVVLVVGNEVTGLAMQTVACANHLCHLPMRGGKESLNVAVAFGVAAYQVAGRFFKE